jgi:hypothetical protein
VLLAGIWVAGVVIAVSLAFAAVARVANGVAPNDVSHLSQTDIDDELAGATTTSPTSGAPTSSATATSSTSTVTTTSRTTAPTASTTTPTTGGSILTSPPTDTTSPTISKLTPTTNTTVAKPPPVTPHNTVTTSQGGTVYTRCTAPDKIAYVAAVPKSGYARTVDIENPDGIKQVFVNNTHASKIQAECSNGVVHAEVEEDGDDD